MTEIRLGRLVVTGHSEGRAVVVSDSTVEPTVLGGSGVAAHFLYGRDDIPTFPDDGAVQSPTTPFPTPGGCRVSYLTIPAGANEDYFTFVVSALGDLADQKNPGFHRTPTLDLCVVMRGEVTLEVDEGPPTRLGVGDLVVQNGTRHRWSNMGEEDAVLATVVLGARTR